MKQLFSFVLVVFSLVVATAQELPAIADTLPTVRLQIVRTFNREPGAAVMVLPQADLAAYHHTDAARLLSERTPVFIKQYGPGQLATSAFRGGSAAHTALLWNGLPLNDPLNGQLDLSLLPVGLFDDISLQMGGGSTLWGSGAVGGSVHFNNRPAFEERLRFNGQYTMGSFGFHNQFASISGSKKNWAASLKLARVRLENDFTFHNPLFPGAPDYTMPQLNLQQEVVMAHVHRKIKQTGLLTFGYWGQNMQRNLQPTVFQWPQTAAQTDGAQRLHLAYEGQHKRWAVVARSGFFKTALRYTDSVSQLVADAQTITALNQVQVARQIGALDAQLGVHHQSQFAQYQSFDGFVSKYRHPEQHQLAVFVAPTYQSANKRLELRAIGRQAVFDGAPIPFQYSFGGAYQLHHLFKWRAHAGTVYRVPTLNDRFWDPGGQPDLRPEAGFNTETGIDFQWNARNQKTTLEGMANVFSRRVRDWIQWLPAGNFWSPQNIDNVWSRGVEVLAKGTVKYGPHQTTLQANSNYILSTSATNNLQLLYVPLYATNLRISQQYKRLHIAVFHQYTGYRYTATDHSAHLLPFHVWNVQVAADIKNRWLLGEIFCRLNNALNTNYYAVAYRPMPGRFWEFGLHFSIVTNK